MTRKSDPFPKATKALRDIVAAIDSGKKPSFPMLQQIRSLAIDALEELHNPDPRVQKICTAALVIRHCTRIEVKKVFGKPKESLRILNHEVLTWAISQIHSIGAPNDS